jgi:hypothetical protein
MREYTRSGTCELRAPVIGHCSQRGELLLQVSKDVQEQLPCSIASTGMASDRIWVPIVSDWSLSVDRWHGRVKKGKALRFNMRRASPKSKFP